jgi:hypothetical protein
VNVIHGLARFVEDVLDVEGNDVASVEQRRSLAGGKRIQEEVGEPPRALGSSCA